MDQRAIRARNQPGGVSSMFFIEDSSAPVAAGNKLLSGRKALESSIIFGDQLPPVVKQQDGATAQDNGAQDNGVVPVEEVVTYSTVPDKTAVANATFKDAVAMAQEAVAMAKEAVAMARNAGATADDMATVKEILGLKLAEDVAGAAVAQSSAKDFPNGKGLALVEQNSGAVVQDKPADFKIGAAGGAKDATDAKIQGEEAKAPPEPTRRCKVPPGGYSSLQLW